MMTGLALPARAQAVEELTEENVTEFITQTSAIAAGYENGMSSDEVLQFLDDHLESHARFKSVMRYTIPGYDPQETSMSLSKEEFMDNVKNSPKKVEDYENSVLIRSVKISSDGKKATVQTHGKESGEMPIKDENGEDVNLPMHGVSACDQIIMLSKKGVIQMYSANCVTEVEFTMIE